MARDLHPLTEASKKNIDMHVLKQNRLEFITEDEFHRNLDEFLKDDGPEIKSRLESLCRGKPGDGQT